MLKRSSLPLIASVLSVACGPAGEDGDGTSPTPEVSTRLAFVTTVADDYSAGSLSVVDRESLTVQADVAGTSSDASVWVRGGRLYLCARDWGGGNHDVTVHDPLTLAELGAIELADFANPYDVQIVGDVGYVSLFGVGTVVTFDPESFEVTGEISLATWADADGNSEPSQMAVDGETLWVGLGRIDFLGTYESVYPGHVARINTTTGDVSAVTLSGTNPGSLLVHGDELLVADAGSFSSTDGGIEVLDKATGESLGFLVTESDLGDSFLSSFVALGGEGWLTTGGELRSFGLDSGVVSEPAAALSGVYAYGVSATPWGELWVRDATSLYAFDPETGTATEAIDVGQYAPYDVDSLEQ